MQFVQEPNLPKAAVGLMAVSATYPEILMELKSFGIKVIPVEARALLAGPVQSHADMACHHLGGRKIIAAKGENQFAASLRQYGFEVLESDSIVCDPYPNDSALNAARIGSYLIANSKVLDRTILNDCILENIKIIEVRQGYAKCSTAVVDEKSIITSDRGIELAAKRVGLSVLKIRPGFIRLPGYAYGFIGGACGLISRNELVFTGNPKVHPDFDQIKKFLDCRKIKITALSERPLLDIGGMIPLMEKER
ncbi:MAG: hypothetical protein LKJ17_01085 [Oscillospiraceae bacterium]|jgi:hypothetical protein|nr:hypothetical protein [Oscillospiraceae bacterium]